MPPDHSRSFKARARSDEREPNRASEAPPELFDPEELVRMDVAEVHVDATACMSHRW